MRLIIKIVVILLLLAIAAQFLLAPLLDQVLA